MACPHGINPLSCPTCWRVGQQTAKPKPKVAAPPPPATQIRITPPPPDSFDADKVWQPPVHPQVSKRQRGRTDT